MTIYPTVKSTSRVALAAALALTVMVDACLHGPAVAKNGQGNGGQGNGGQQWRQVNGGGK